MVYVGEAMTILGDQLVVAAASALVCLIYSTADGGKLAVEGVAAEVGTGIVDIESEAAGDRQAGERSDRGVHVGAKDVHQIL